LTGTPVQYNLRTFISVLERIEAYDDACLADSELRAQIDQARARVLMDEPLDELLPEVYGAVREACARVLAMRPFDVQIMAAIALHRGELAQMATGEGKTLVAVLPAILNALRGKGVHIFTANDYLARRDAEWMGPVYRFLGLTAGFVQQGMSTLQRQGAYASDITYVTAKEAGFDFLRDHTAESPGQIAQRPYHYVIVDEADFILIDEARVPLVIAGSSESPDVDHAALAVLARKLRPRIDYRTDEYDRNVTLTDAGFRIAEALLGCGGLHKPKNHLLRTSFSAVAMRAGANRSSGSEDSMSSAPTGTKAGASTINSGAAPADRAIQAVRGFSSASKTTSSSVTGS